jgi:hypothetical protein
MTIKADKVITKRCYSERAVELAVERARSHRKRTERKPAVKDTSDPALIMAIAECRGCPGYGKFWIENKLKKATGKAIPKKIPGSRNA